MLRIRLPRRNLKTRERVQRLIDRGVTDRFEVAERLGIHPEYARQLLRDPSEAAAIKRGRGNRVVPEDPVRCEICGELLTVIGTHLRVHDLDLATYRQRYPNAPTVSPSFRAGGRDVYADRLDVHPDEAQHWTRERIITAIQVWARRTGDPPGARDWRRRVSSRGWTIGKEVTHHRPSMARVIQVFGSWSAAIKAAGFKPRGAGYQRGTKYRYNRPRPTHCKRGHPLRGNNLYVNPSGYRQCRACHRLRMRRRYRRLKGIGTS
jgi:hypothetical protein